MELLFSYGTLQLPKVQQETFGRLLKGDKDILLGYQLSKVTIHDEAVIAASGMSVHPILRYTGDDNDEVEGTIFEVTENELQQSDEYEVEQYCRARVNFKSGRQAWAYVAGDDVTSEEL